jgi:hypothetical protein
MLLSDNDLIAKVDEAKANHIPLEVLARELGITYNALHSKLYRVRKKVKSRPELFNIQLGSAPLLTGDWMIVGDVQIPSTDYEFALLPALVAKKHLRKSRQLLIAGDFWNMDAFSTYPNIVPLPSWKEEMDAGGQLLCEWLEEFDRIVLLEGNHERRLVKLTNGEAWLEMFYRDPRIEFTRYPYAVIQNGSEWRVTHPKGYSKDPLKVANYLALKHQQNIISFHEHHFGLTYDEFGRHIIINGGGLFDPKKMAYVVMDDNKTPTMVPGFVMLKGGYPYLFGKDKLTDWSRWL